MSHRPLCHNATVVLCVYLMAKYTNACPDIETIKKKTEESGTPSSLRSKTSSSLNLTSPAAHVTRLPYCRDVTIGVASSGLAP